MVKTIKIVKSDSKWHLEFEGKTFPIKESDSWIMDLLKPTDNQTCIITDASSEGAVCYFVKRSGVLKVYSFPDEVLRIESDVNIIFFRALQNDVKYYLIPVQ